MSSYSIVTAPSVEPLTLTDVKNWLRVDGSDDDNLITSLIKSARLSFENETWRPLCTQTWQLNLGYSDVKQFVGISKSPVQSIESITFTDIHGKLNTMTSGVDWQQDLLNEPANIRFTPKPTTKDIFNALTIKFVCGYGVAASVPEDIKTALLLLIGHWYEHRESVTPGNFSQVPSTTKDLIQGYKNTWFWEYQD